VTQPVIQTGFSAGELSPACYGKVDIDAYHIGAATMRNVFVDYRSGATSRAGTAFVGPAGGSYPAAPRLIPFRFSSAEAYVIVLGQETARFIYEGAYVIETGKDISSVSLAASCEVGIAGHGYSTGDLIYIDGVTGSLWPSNANSGLNARFFIVTVVDANTVMLNDWITGQPINSSTWSAYVAGGAAARVYTLATPYQAADLRLIKYTQSGDVLTLTHPHYPPADLTQIEPTDWTLTQVTFGSSLAAPKQLQVVDKANDGGAQQYGIGYEVTAFNDATKEESTASAYVRIGNEALMTENGSGGYPTNYLTWDAVVGATRYNVYADVPVPEPGEDQPLPAPTYVLGYIGQSTVPSFTDTNIAPDFSQSPPIHFNPFASSGVSSITITFPAPASNPPALLGLISPLVSYSGGSTVTPQFSVTLSNDGWGNINGAGAAIDIIVPGDGLPAGGGSITITDQAPGPGSGLTCGFALAFAVDSDASDWEISNPCIAAAFSGGSNYHPLLNTQLCPGYSALAYEGAVAVPASTYNAVTKGGVGYLEGGAVVVRYTPSGGSQAVVQGCIQLVNGATSGMAVTDRPGVTAGTPPAAYTWSIMYDDMAANIVTITGSYSGGAQAATTTTTTPYASYAAPGDGFGPVPYVVAGATYPFAASNFSNPPAVTGSYAVNASANYPGVCFYFQGRKGYAASVADPQTVWLTRPDLFQNMDYSDPSEADDGVDITINAQDLSTIQSATAMPSGLVLLTADGAWQVTGGGLYQPVTPSTINAQPQAFSGASPLQPLRINYTLIYVQARGYAVRRLEYNFYFNVYTGTDISVLSSHLFEGRQIVEWCWAEQPYYLAWCLRDDGILLSMTFLPEQNIQGWARHDTQGYFRSVCVIPQVPEGAG
jgi:hypothetical protein